MEDSIHYRPTQAVVNLEAIRDQCSEFERVFRKRNRQLLQL